MINNKYLNLFLGSAFVGVWRLDDYSNYMLVGETELPPARVGVHVVQLETPIKVMPSDFIGIYYPQSAEQNVIAQTQEGANLYQCYEAAVSLVVSFHSSYYFC